MSDSDKESVIPATTSNNIPRNKIERSTKHVRRRHWTPWEEMKLAELWYRYQNEVTTTVKHLPVFTTISGEMRSYGFCLNSQECRRKINQFKNKYMIEEQRIKSLQTGNKEVEFEWKLYPLIHTVLNPTHKPKDVYHERNIVKQLLSKMPPIPAAQRKQRRSLTLTSKTEDQVIKQENGFTATTTSPRTPPQPPPNPYKRIYTTFSTSSLNATNCQQRRTNYRSPDSCYQTRYSVGSIDFRLRSFKIPRLENLKRDNARLTEHRDFALRNLGMQEREVNMFEKLVQGLQCGGK